MGSLTHPSKSGGRNQGDAMEKIQIVHFKTGKVVKEISVTGKSERQIQKIDDGININLNHEQFFTRMEAQ